MLFPKVNEKATKEKVDGLLKNYHKIRRLSGMPIEQKVTATYSLDPKSFTDMNSSAIENGTIKKLDAVSLYRDINAAINTLDAYSRKRIYDKYINSTRYYDYEVLSAEQISEATYYREVGKAMIEFAEAFQSGGLLIFENE
ncbi:ArpU family phage transcriptional regulator [Aerococcus sp. 150760007-1]|uniref:ArpU family transcriptional regulator n=1 Tax=Aerococcus urinaeequi TaxID=51665 RepID=A0ABR5ZY69_9LACT|nr:ArpU family phage packaging/lysis transcriptional regulator [Aerococcus urinaeequi]MBA5746679.1 ArpU family transcriptional regulator [Aerococcus urinaeequi]MBA5829526.1 ArpU family transcriptional regulator [Aerococcus urinaeequi]MBA5860367.1 ArpU family transcriptional regulator [Aerococcus urinaeequi]